jgi:alpha-mannosidase
MTDKTFSPPTALPLELYVVPGSHFDLGWVLDPDGALALGDHIIYDAIALIRGPHPEFRFTIEYVMFLRHFLETYPELHDVVREMLHDGRLEACASMTGMMEQILDGEALIRQFTHGIRWLQQAMDYTPRCAQHTDLPGHTIQMPQILAKCGIPFVAYSRYRPPCPLHQWAAPDGTTVLACNHVHHYEWGRVLRTTLKDAETALLDSLAGPFRDIWPAQQVLMPEERDLDWAEPKVCENAKAWNAAHSDVARVRFAVLADFFKAVDTRRVPTYAGEAPYGFYSIPAFEPQTYQQCRRAENALTAAERFAVTRRLEGLGAVPTRRFDAAWEELFWAHDHNIAGQDGPINDAVRTHRAERARVEAESILREIEASYLLHAQTDETKGKAFLVFNPLSWRRDGVCELRMELPGPRVDGVEVVDADGAAAPTQMLHVERADEERIDYQLDDPDLAEFQARLAFVAKDVPATGYKTFYVRKAAGSATGATTAAATGLENEHFKIAIAGGRITSLVCKRTGRDIAADAPDGFFSVVALEDLRGDLEDGYDPWDPRENAPNYTGREWPCEVDPQSVTVVESGPARTIIRIDGRLLGCPVTQEIELYDAVPRATLRVAIDWDGQKNRQVRARLPLAIGNPTVTYETPFGSVVFGRDEMPNTYRGDGTRWVQKWIDASEPGFGVTFSAGCCAWNIAGATLSPLLVQTTYCRGDAYYWTRNRGRHAFAFSLHTHDGDWAASRHYGIGWEHWSPLRVDRAQPRLVSVPGRARLPDRREYVRCDHPAVVVSTLKDAYDGDGCVLRLFNVTRETVETEVRFGFDVAGAAACDMMERSTVPAALAGNTLAISLGPFEIATYRLTTRTRCIA